MAASRQLVLWVTTRHRPAPYKALIDELNSTANRLPSRITVRKSSYSQQLKLGPTQGAHTTLPEQMYEPVAKVSVHSRMLMLSGINKIGRLAHAGPSFEQNPEVKIVSEGGLLVSVPGSSCDPQRRRNRLYLVYDTTCDVAALRSPFAASSCFSQGRRQSAAAASNTAKSRNASSALRNAADCIELDAALYVVCLLLHHAASQVRGTMQLHMSCTHIAVNTCLYEQDRYHLTQHIRACRCLHEPALRLRLPRLLLLVP